MEVESIPSTSLAVPESLQESSKLGLCEVCTVQSSKYTCPRCEVKTCSLKCSTIHKKELECDGSRDRTRFVPLNRFTNLDLSSDYRLLEEITRTLETSRKNYRSISKQPVLPPHLYKLKKSAQDRNTTLKFLPPSFQRSKRNTTRLNFHKNVIFWHIEWVFTNADNLRLDDDQVRESDKLISILSKYLVKQEDPSLQDRLQYYQAADLPGIKVLLRAEGKAGRKYYELDPLLSLKENLFGKTVIEFPIIHIVLKEHVGGMDVIDSDDEDADDVKPGETVINNIIKKSESDDSIYMSLKNLLFISDGEMSE